MRQLHLLGSTYFSICRNKWINGLETHHSTRNITSWRCPPLRCSHSASRSWTLLMVLRNTSTGVLEISSCIRSFSSWVVRGDGVQHTTLLRLSGVRVGNATRVAATVTEMRVALTEMRRRAGVSGQTPSRGTPCPGRLSGRPVQGLLPTGTLLRFFQLLGTLVSFGRGHGFHCWSHSAKIGCRQ